MIELQPKKERVSRAHPSDDMTCEWCEKVKPTTVNEVWCDADPAGHLVRLCDDCCSKCAGG